MAWARSIPIGSKVSQSPSRNFVNLKWIAINFIRCNCYWRIKVVISNPSGSGANCNRDDLLIGGPASHIIASPIVDNPPCHPIKGYMEHNAHTLRVIDAFVIKLANGIDLSKIKAEPTHAQAALRPIHTAREHGSRTIRVTYISNTPYNIQS